MKTMLLIVPHPDDELLVGGGLLFGFANAAEWNCNVLYVTNGDFFSQEANLRLQEAIDSCSVLGIKEENVIFLGYGDQWNPNGPHIYHSNGTEILKSAAGRCCTYGLDTHPEYRYKIDGRHNQYTRKNIKKDLSDVIMNLLPEVIIYVNYDVHPDHRATMLLCEECLGELLKSEKNYRPLLLTKLAYEGIYNAKNDYHHLPHPVSLLYKERITSTPLLKWGDRIQLKVPQQCNTLLYKKNILYKAAYRHNSQEVKYVMKRACNADIVYWIRESNNLALLADIQVSSGQGRYINDFKIIDSNDILKKNGSLAASVWYPDNHDKEKNIKITWKSKQSIKRIILYENPDTAQHVCSVLIKLTKDQHIYENNIKEDGSATRIELTSSVLTSAIEIRIIKCIGEKAGFTEIEFYDSDSDILVDKLPVPLYKNEDGTVAIKDRVYSLTEWMLTSIEEFMFNKVFPSKYVMTRKYPFMKNKNYLYFFIWPDYLVHKVFKKAFRK